MQRRLEIGNPRADRLGTRRKEFTGATPEFAPSVSSGVLLTKASSVSTKG